MAEMTRGSRSPMQHLRREIEDAMEDFDLPRRMRRELDHLLGADLSPRSLWREMDRLFEDFESPPSLRRRIARAFEDLTSRGGGERGRGMFAPQLDLTEREDEYLMRVDLPGMREQDVNVEVDDDNVLTISGERRQEEKRRERGYEYTERAYGSFSRSVQLPRGVDASRVDAEMRNGVLEVHVPKTEAGRSRRISIGGQRGGKEEPRVMGAGNGGGQAGAQR